MGRVGAILGSSSHRVPEFSNTLSIILKVVHQETLAHCTVNRSSFIFSLMGGVAEQSKGGKRRGNNKKRTFWQGAGKQLSKYILPFLFWPVGGGWCKNGM